MSRQSQAADAGDTSNSDSGFAVFSTLLFFTAVMLEFSGNFPERYQQLVSHYAVPE